MEVASDHRTPASAAAAPGTAARPLYVDLDGSLIRSDLLVESALLLLKRGVANLARMLLWLAGARRT